jgi:hypothetical protein
LCAIAGGYLVDLLYSEYEYSCTPSECSEYVPNEILGVPE